MICIILNERKAYLTSGIFCTNVSGVLLVITMANSEFTDTQVLALKSVSKGTTSFALDLYNVSTVRFVYEYSSSWIQKSENKKK